MKNDEIYDHLAKVYLGKRTHPPVEEKKHAISTWLIINVVITVVILASAFYGLTAFLAKRSDVLQTRVIYSLSRGPIKIPYNLNDPYPQIKTFSLSIPEMNLEKYNAIKFSARGRDEGSPGVIKLILTNQKNETDSLYIRDIDKKWQEIQVPFEDFDQISDWSQLSDISFVLEGWNVDQRKGILLIDNICFSN